MVIMNKDVHDTGPRLLVRAYSDDAAVVLLLVLLALALALAVIVAVLG